MYFKHIILIGYRGITPEPNHVFLPVIHYVLLDPSQQRGLINLTEELLAAAICYLRGRSIPEQRRAHVAVRHATAAHSPVPCPIPKP